MARLVPHRSRLDMKEMRDRHGVGLLEAFLLFVAVLFILETAAHYYASVSAADKTSREILARVAETIEGKIAGIRDSTEYLLFLTKEFSDRETVDFGDVSQTNAFYMGYVRNRHPFISSVNYGDSDGNGYLILGAEGRWKNRIKKGTEPGSVTWTTLDERGGILSRVRRADDYDPRKTTWYENARSSSGVAWSRPYIFRTTRDVGITASMRIGPGRSGAVRVVGVDVMLKDLSRFLADLKKTEGELSIFLVSPGGEILASSEEKDFARLLRKDSLDLPRVSEGGFPALSAAVRGFEKGKGDFQSVSSPGGLHYALRTRLSLSRDTGVTIVLATPRESLLSAFRRVNRVRWILFITLLGASGFLFARRYIAPIRKLTRAVRTFGTDGYDPPPEQARGDEVGILVSEFRRMAEAIREREREIRDRHEAMELAATGADLGLWDWDLASGRFVIGDSFSGSLGYPHGEFGPRLEQWATILHPDDLPKARQDLAAHLKGGTPLFEAELRIRSRTGEWRWVMIRGKVVARDSNGRAVRVVGTAINITGRKEVEDRILQAKKEWERTFDAVTDPIMILDPGYRIVRVNRAMAEKLGSTPEKLVGLTCHNAVHGLDDPIPGCAFTKLLEDGNVNPSEMRESRLGGIFEVSVSPVYDEEGNLAAGIHFARDVSKRKQAEEALRQSEKRFRDLLNDVDLVGVMLDREGNILFCNRFLLALTGWSIEEVTGRSWFDLFLPEDARDEILNVFRGTLANVKDYRVYESPVVTRSGERRLISWSNTTLRDGQGNVIGVAAIGNDVTNRNRAEKERKNLQEQLQQAMKMEAVGRLAGGVAHDFNNLLTAIIGNVSLALMKLPPSDPAEVLLVEANKAASRAATLTQQLLAFSRKQIIEPKVLDLNLLIAELSKMLVRLIGEDIELEIVPGGDLGPVKVDAGQFEQVMVNLAVNARDAMPGGGKLTIETANADLGEEYCSRHPYVRPGRFVMLAVSDTGHGISEEVREKIFEPFFTTKPKGSGTGLGLATTYGVVKQSGGSIEVASEVGKGTTFRIFLPRADGGSARPGGSEPPAEPLRGSETVLVVEDEEIVRKLCVQVLEELGYRVMQAGNGDAAIDLATGWGERIDLLMTDVVMPGMHGRELANRLARIHPEAKVIFTSGYTDNAIVHHGVLDEGVSFLGKPYTPTALAKKVREVLGHVG